MNAVTKHQTFTTLNTELAIHQHIDDEITNYKYDNLLFVQMLCGSKNIRLKNGQEVLLDQNQILMSSVEIEAEVETKGAKDEKPSICFTLEIDKSKVSNIISKLNEQYDISKIISSEDFLNDNAVYKVENSFEIVNTIEKLKNLHTNDNLFKDNYINLAIEELIMKSLQSDLSYQLINNYSLFLNSHPLSFAVDYIKKNIRAKINVDTLADKVNMSRATFYRQFKVSFGMSPISFIQSERINLSKAMLKNKDYSISDICYDLGYSSPSYFIKQFKEIVGMSPTTYRMMQKDKMH